MFKKDNRKKQEGWAEGERSQERNSRQKQKKIKVDKSVRAHLSAPIKNVLKI